MIVIVILAVVGGVLLVHVILEVLTSRYRQWRRHRNQLQSESNNVKYNTSLRTHSSKMEEGSDEDTDAQETSRLIFFDESARRGGDTRLFVQDAVDRDFDTRQESLRLISPTDSHSTMDDGICSGSGNTSPMVGLLEPQHRYSTMEIITEDYSSEGNSIRTNGVEKRDTIMPTTSTGSGVPEVVLLNSVFVSGGSSDPKDEGGHFIGPDAGRVEVETAGRDQDGFLEIDIHS